MKTMQEMSSRQFLRFARRQARAAFLGLAIPTVKDAGPVPANLPARSLFPMLADRVTMPDGSRGIRSEKVLKFNRAALVNPPRKRESEPVGDLSIIRAGKPGSKERIEAYRKWNEANGENSPFMEE